MNEMEWDKALCYLLGSIVAKYYDEYVCVCVCVCVSVVNLQVTRKLQ